ncbi:MAG: Serine/threonine-protein kinase PknD [Cyanobacteria bacterium RYN_339]|nr:Serine/threonine-protein kinase PknD [Cyanobacteria bacterium RYN_339]
MRRTTPILAAALIAACTTQPIPETAAPLAVEPEAGASRHLMAFPAMSAAAAAAAYAAHKGTLGSGLAGPNGLAVDGADNIYEADWNRGSVTKITQAGVSTRYVSGVLGAAGLAFDLGGNMLIAAYNGATLEKAPPGGGTHTSLAKTGLLHPVWPAVDSTGKVYLADYSHNRIALVSPTGVATTFKSMTGVNAIAVDNANNLWVCSWAGVVAKITPAGVMTTIATGLPTACGIAWSPNYLAICTYGAQTSPTGRLLLMDFAGKQFPVASGLDRASSVIFDHNGNLYVADVGDLALKRYLLAGAVPPPAPGPVPVPKPTPTPVPKPTPTPVPKPPTGQVFQTGTATVTIGPGGVYTPSHVFVRPGAVSHFVNIDNKPHTVTGFGGATSNSGPLPPGGSYNHSWIHPGTWTFHDTLTPNPPTFSLTDVPL